MSGASLRNRMTIEALLKLVHPILMCFDQSTVDHQNPGRVVTLVHKEDWDLYSGSVFLSPRNPRIHKHLIPRMHFHTKTSCGGLHTR